jgi:hypothetical protein
MKRMARFWIISIVWIWALEQGSQTADPYSSMGRHSAVYARSLLLRFAEYNTHLMNPKVFVDLVTRDSMWELKERLF